nr:hypothetical protein [Tanacetum cinerariifolium]
SSRADRCPGCKRTKRATGERGSEKESANKQKTSEEVPEEAMSPEEVPEEKDKEIFMLVEKDYPLRKGLALMMISYKLQVKNYSHMANDLILKIYKIANSPRQQEQLPTASEERCHYQTKSKATARKISLLSKVKKKLSVKVK